MEDRFLSPESEAAYVARLADAGYTFTASGDPIEPMGFDVVGNGECFNYRYDGGATTAVALMERICSERGI